MEYKVHKVKCGYKQNEFKYNTQRCFQKNNNLDQKQKILKH